MSKIVDANKLSRSGEVYLEAQAKVGKKIPRQCRSRQSSSVVGLHHSSTRLERSLALITRPHSNSLAIPSAATSRKSTLWGKNINKCSIYNVTFWSIEHNRTFWANAGKNKFTVLLSLWEESGFFSVSQQSAKWPHQQLNDPVRR